MKDNEPTFRKPAMLDAKNGTYVTAGQIRFFLNKRDALMQIKDKSDAFTKFISFCKFYNYFWDITELFPEEGFMFWDHESETIAFQFPARGRVSKYLSLYGK